MEVKEGYKQTDVGVIPENWKTPHLGQIASVAAGGTPSRSIPEYWDGGIPWVTTTEVDFNTIWKTEQSISFNGLKNSAAKLLSPGTLLLALYGQGKTRGKVAILGIEAATNQACASIEVTPEVSREYVFHFLSSRYDVIRGMSNLGSQDNLNGGIVKSLQIALPATKAEQEAIATALFDVDTLIKSLDQLIAKKRDINQAAMRELLTGKRRLPEFCGGNGYQDSDLGSIPEDWQIFPVSQLGEVKRGASSQVIKYVTTGGVRLIRINDFFEYNPVFVSPTNEIMKFALAENDILFAGTGSVGATCIPKENWIGVPHSYNAPRIRVRKTQSKEYLLFSLRSDYVAHQQSAWFVGAVQQFLDIKAISNLKIAYPPTIDEQYAIVTVLSDFDNELAALEHQRDKTKAIKQGMMQELLTGQIRLT